ncbi:MAG: S-methyl-5-thioribose-1-phosphate isomerase [Gemmataceae bacterium]|nr:S-methyl-5-thioribose-1-phosphate isomerase [Gemmataceae bacterium]
MSFPAASVPAVQWVGDPHAGFVRLIDQTLLPTSMEWRDCRTVEELWEAIRMLRVRGAPAIGVAAAFGVVLGAQTDEAPLRRAAGDRLPLPPGEGWGEGAFSCETPRRTPSPPAPLPEGEGRNTGAARLTALEAAIEKLRTSRPTAVNLFWALDRMKAFADKQPAGLATAELRQRLLDEARVIFDEDRAMCLAMGKLGADLIRDGMGVLTHCNAGALATADYGTALAAMFVAHEQGKKFRVFADETRPLLQGARLTAWELHCRGIDVTLICDNMAAQVMRESRIHLVLVGADRITANGDAANKIGTYGVAVLAKAHGIPFYVVAPSSTVDLSLATGAGIPIEQRDPREITHGFGKATAPEGVKVYNPAFDVTPAELLTGIITEKGIVSPVSEELLRSVLAR